MGGPTRRRRGGYKVSRQEFRRHYDAIDKPPQPMNCENKKQLRSKAFQYTFKRTVTRKNTLGSSEKCQRLPLHVVLHARDSKYFRGL